MTVTLEGVRSIVDDLGGIPMILEEPIDYLPGKYLAAGEQVLTGQQAEWLVRYREGYATGDIGRLEVQQASLKAAVQAVYAKGRAEAIAALDRNYSQVETDMPLLSRRRRMDSPSMYFNVMLALPGCLCFMLPLTNTSGISDVILSIR